jgi:hypothetical protein
MAFWLVHQRVDDTHPNSRLFLTSRLIILCASTNHNKVKAETLTISLQTNYVAVHAVQENDLVKAGEAGHYRAT